MVRAWLRAVVVGALVGTLGCGGGSHDSIITDTKNILESIATSEGSLKTSIDDFVQKKKDGDAEGAKKALDEAVTQASAIEEAAKKLQREASRVGNLKALSLDEKKANVKKHETKINQARDGIIVAHRDMKKALADAKANHEESLAPLMQALAKAENELAAIVRKK